MRHFEFRSGALSLDLADTVADRDGVDVELLGTPEDVGRWATASGKLPFMSGVDVSEGELETLRVLREDIYTAASSVVADGDAKPLEARVINDAAARRPARAVLTAGGMDLVADDPVAAMFAAIATDAIGLLGSDRRHRLRRCQECRMLFFDASPPGKRLWCSSSSGCGNRAKIRRHRESMKKPKDHPC